MAIKISGTAVITDSRVITNLGQPLAISQGGTSLTSAGNTGNILVSDGTKYVSQPLVTATSVAYAWGDNSYGQLGDNTTTSRSSPVTVVGGITNWQQLSSGTNSLGLTQDRIAYAWGRNSFGQIGDNTTTSRSSPVTVVGGITNWAQISSSGAVSLGITQAGIAYGWGFNTNGNLGDNTTTSRSSPVTVVGGITNWAHIQVLGMSLGLTQDGIAYAWGVGSYGRLGNGTITNRSSPVTVVGGINWQQLAAGREFALGVTQGGIAYAWGRNSSGQLGTNNTTSRSSPVTVVGGITNWAQLAAGDDHSLGVTRAGIAYAWGSNFYGQLGDNTTDGTRTSPVTVVGGITNWAQVSGGYKHSLGLTQAGIAYAWGDRRGLGINETTPLERSSPVTVSGGITNWAQLSAGNDGSLGLTSTYVI